MHHLSCALNCAKPLHQGRGTSKVRTLILNTTNFVWKEAGFGPSRLRSTKKREKLLAAEKFDVLSKITLQHKS